MSDQPESAGHPCTAATGNKLLDEIAELERRLPHLRTDDIAAAALADDIRRRILGGTVGGATASTDNNAVPDILILNAGTKLWNQVLSLGRYFAGNASPVYKRLLLHGRAFAFLAVHSAGWKIHTKPNAGPPLKRVLWLLDMCSNAASGSIRERDTELGRVALDKASMYRERVLLQLGRCPVNEDTDRMKEKYRVLQAQIIVCRTVQLWLENKPEAAEMTYDHEWVLSVIEPQYSDSAEIFAAFLYDIGKTLMEKREYSVSIVWFNRSHEIVGRLRQISQISDSLITIQNNATYALAVASIGLGTPHGRKRARELVQDIQAQLGPNCLRTNIVNLELIAAETSEGFDAPRFSKVLLNMIENFDGSNKAARRLHHYIQKLHSKSPGLGCEVLDSFLLALRETDSTEWIEKLVIARVWLLVQQRGAQEGIDAAEHVLSKLRKSMSANTTAAAQTLMWKKIEQGYQEKQYATAIRWCCLSMCHIFEAGSRTNRALVERRLLSCYIESGDLETARTTYESMPEPTQDDTMTQYLLFKLSVRLNDMAMALKCLKHISLSADARDFLYACILYARNSKAVHFTVQALKKLADTTNYDSQDPVHTPALFRCTILMLEDIIKESAADLDDKSGIVAAASRDLATIFEGVVEAIEASRNANVDTATRGFSIDELDWFCRASYSQGLKYSRCMDLRSTARVLMSWRKIIKLFPENSEAQALTDVASKTLNCHFLIASTMSALAREPETPIQEEQVIKDYRVMREHVMAFLVLLRQFADTGNTSEISLQYSSKLPALFVFDFEGAIGLGDWDELQGICEKAAVCRSPDTFRVMGDILLQSQARVPIQNFLSTLRFIIDKLRQAGGFGCEKLVKYYRCLFQGALYRDNDFAFRILEEVCETLQDATVGMVTILMKDQSWPEDDIQHLAIKAFNEGISWFAQREEGRVRQWALLADRLSDRCRDGGSLKETIRRNFLLLDIGDLELRRSIEEDEEDTKETVT